MHKTEINGLRAKVTALEERECTDQGKEVEPEIIPEPEEPEPEPEKEEPTPPAVIQDGSRKKSWGVRKRFSRGSSKRVENKAFIKNQLEKEDYL